MPGGGFTVCDYKSVYKVPDNYHIEYDGHYYSVVYSYCGKPAILKATSTEIRICDQYNRLICKHKRAYTDFPLYITENDHMRPEHLYYKEVNAKDGAYYRRWASVFGPNNHPHPHVMSFFILARTFGTMYHQSSDLAQSRPVYFGHLAT